MLGKGPVTDIGVTVFAPETAAAGPAARETAVVPTAEVLVVGVVRLGHEPLPAAVALAASVSGSHSRDLLGARMP